jgi:hypothetical protein
MLHNLRQIMFLQKWKEIAISGDQNYRDQVYKHFGVKVPAALSSMSTFIGGDAGNLMINEVVNQSFGGDDPNATIKGKGIGSGSGFQNFEANEHGVLMCIYHAVPLLDYVRTGPDPGFLPTLSTDLPIPEFDKLGFENVPAVVLTNNAYLLEGSELSPTWISQNLGYVPRYYWMKRREPSRNTNRRSQTGSRLNILLHLGNNLGRVFPQQTIGNKKPIIIFTNTSKSRSLNRHSTSKPLSLNTKLSTRNYMSPINRKKFSDLSRK